VKRWVSLEVTPLVLVKVRDTTALVPEAFAWVLFTLTLAILLQKPS